MFDPKKNLMRLDGQVMSDYIGRTPQGHLIIKARWLDKGNHEKSNITTVSVEYFRKRYGPRALECIEVGC